MTNRGLLQLAVILALALAGMYLLAPLWGAILLSTLFYLLLQPAAVWLQTRGWQPATAISVVLGLPMLALGLLTAYLFVELANYLPHMSGDLEQLRHGLANAMYSLDSRITHFTGAHLHLAQLPQKLRLPRDLDMNQVLASSGLVANILLNLLLTPLLAWFLIRDYRSLRDRLLALLPNSQMELGWLMYRRITDRLQKYLRALVIQASILATITGIGFAIAGFPSALLLGILTGIAGFVPYFGPLLAMVPPFLVLLAQPHFEPVGVLHAALVLTVGFGFDNLVTIPFIVAGTVEVHPGLALIAVLIAGNVAGIPGMVLIIPLLGMLGIIFRTLFEGLRGDREQWLLSGQG